MSLTLVLPTDLASELRRLVESDVETGGVLLVRCVSSGGSARLLGLEFLEVPEHAYVRRARAELVVASEGYVYHLARAADLGATPLWLHTHVGLGAIPVPSRLDERVDEELAEVFRIRADADTYGSVVAASGVDGLAFTGRVLEEGVWRQIDRLVEIGSRIVVTDRQGTSRPPPHTTLDRNVRALGGDVQHTIGDLRIAVVGCGGTGSAVGEQLVRLGARHLLLVDPDDLSDSNVSRVYGSFPDRVGRLKVDVLREHLMRIAPGSDVVTAPSSVTDEATARLLASVDVVFGCTDDNAGRLVLSRLATYLLVLVIDCGVLVSSDADQRIEGIDGRVTVLHPGTACLVCRGRVDLARAALEGLNPEERESRVGEGYAPALPDVEPAVVTFTTLTAAVAVSELIERLTRYGPEPAPSEVLLRIHEREVSTNHQPPREGHYCDPGSGKLGFGDAVPFLEQTWA